MAPKKKTASPAKKPISKTAFVKSLPASTPGADVVKNAKEAGLTITLGYVYSIRAKAHAKKRTSAAPVPGVPSLPGAPVKRGPGRPRKVASPAANTNGAGSSGGGLAAEIERIVERKVEAVLSARLGALLS
jgi:hypothetical protein